MNFLSTIKETHNKLPRHIRSTFWLLIGALLIGVLAWDEFGRNDFKSQHLTFSNAPEDPSLRITAEFNFQDVEFDAGEPYAVGIFRLKVPEARVVSARSPAIASVDFGVLEEELGGAQLTTSQTFMPIKFQFDGNNFVGQSTVRLLLSPVRPAFWSPFDIYQGGLHANIREGSFLDPSGPLSIDEITLKFNSEWVVAARSFDSSPDVLSGGYAGNHIFNIKRGLTDRIVPTVVLILLLGTVLNLAYGRADVIDISKAVGVFLAAWGARATLGDDLYFITAADYSFLLLSLSLILLLTVNWGRDVLKEDDIVTCTYCLDKLNDGASVCRSCGRAQM